MSRRSSALFSFGFAVVNENENCVTGGGRAGGMMNTSGGADAVAVAGGAGSGELGGSSSSDEISRSTLLRIGKCFGSASSVNFFLAGIANWKTAGATAAGKLSREPLGDPSSGLVGAALLIGNAN
jgi:hypothetical protein